MTMEIARVVRIDPNPLLLLAMIGMSLKMIAIQNVLCE
jgi:hypothetical protein